VDKVRFVVKRNEKLPSRDETPMTSLPSDLPTAAQRRQALRDALHDNDLDAAKLARLAGLPTPNSIYNFLSGHTDDLANKTWARIIRFLPQSDADVLRGLRSASQTIPQPNSQNDDSFQHRVRARAMEQLTRSLTDLRRGLSEAQQAMMVCTNHIAMLEARLTDLRD
jgi:hypothetical protein